MVGLWSGATEHGREERLPNFQRRNDLNMEKKSDTLKFLKTELSESHGRLCRARGGRHALPWRTAGIRGEPGQPGVADRWSFGDRAGTYLERFQGKIRRRFG